MEFLGRRMIAAPMQHIVIVGAGFSGTMTAVNLARLSAAPLRVTLVNHGHPAGRGIAYGTRRSEHLLNVAARNMSALPDHPDHFVAWLRTRSEFADVPEPELREMFIPRRIYGDYVRSLALHFTRSVDPRSNFELTQLDEEAIDLEPADEGDGAIVVCASGHRIAADKVVLATGNEPPADLPGCDALRDHPAYCANPWVNWEQKIPAETENIILLGTGLTTVDAVVTLLALNWGGRIHAVSRNGLLPHAHFKGVDYPAFPPPGVDLAQLGLEPLVRLIETHCVALRRQGANPAIVIDKLRPHTQRIWEAFSLAERREFAARHAARWNVMRHRIAQPIHRQTTTAVESGRLAITRASIERLEACGPHVAVQLRHADGAVTRLEGALVINCTGPHTRFSATQSRLLRNLLASGLAQPDAMDMGICVEPDFAATERGGTRSKFLFAIGPLLRGTLWESIAVPELRTQAMRVAESLLEASPPRARQAPLFDVWAQPPVIEYWI